MYFNLIYTSRYQILIIKKTSSFIYKFIHSSSSCPLKERNFKISLSMLDLLQQTWCQIKELKKFFNLIYTFIYALLTVKKIFDVITFFARPSSDEKIFKPKIFQLKFSLILVPFES